MEFRANRRTVLGALQRKSANVRRAMSLDGLGVGEFRGGCDTRGGFVWKFGTLGGKGGRRSACARVGFSGVRSRSQVRVAHIRSRKSVPLPLGVVVRARDDFSVEIGAGNLETGSFSGTRGLRAARHGRAPN